jgi:protein O-mannosyl-transferase
MTRQLTALAAGLIGAVVCALYLPFISNPLVFDDKGYFSGRRFSDYAAFPFGLEARFPASFSIASIQVLFGTIQAHRLVSLIVHAAVAFALFLVIRRMLEAAPRPASTKVSAPLAALIASALFAVHPVAVYAASYLAQRSLVLATLFALLSGAAFMRGLALGRYRYALGAAALYSMAVLCKEQAILVAGVIPVAAWVLAGNRRFAVRYASIFVVGCVPAAVFVFLLVKGIIGHTYEIQFPDVAAQVATDSESGAGILRTPWLGSVLTQLALFFRYIALWLWPDTDRMSFDLRVDFAATWSPSVAILAVVGYLAWGAAGAILAWRRGRWGMVGFGLLWFWTLFLLEFSVVRFQEPFVLYRSYLWAPGVAIAFAVALERVPPRTLAIGSVALALCLAWQAHDRLRTFSSGLRLWEDAAAKLPQGAVPGGSRTLYEAGREHFYAGQPQKAGALLERCLSQYPHAYHCVFARAAMLIELAEYDEALPYLKRALAVRSGDAVAHHHAGRALEGLGCRDAAIAQYEISSKLGFHGGTERLTNLRNPGKGLLPPTPMRAPVRPLDCGEALKRLEEPPR